MQLKYQKILVNRLHRLRGQLQGIEKMVKQGKYCVEILTQSLAADKSLESFNEKLLENHLSEHVAHQFLRGQGGKAIKELIKIYQLKNRS